MKTIKIKLYHLIGMMAVAFAVSAPLFAAEVGNATVDDRYDNHGVYTYAEDYSHINAIFQSAETKALSNAHKRHQ